MYYFNLPHVLKMKIYKNSIDVVAKKAQGNEMSCMLENFEDNCERHGHLI